LKNNLNDFKALDERFFSYKDVSDNNIIVDKFDFCLKMLNVIKFNGISSKVHEYKQTGDYAS
jgi:hypothetical protein